MGSGNRQVGWVSYYAMKAGLGRKFQPRTISPDSKITVGELKRLQRDPEEGNQIE